MKAWLEENRPDAIFSDKGSIPSILEKLGCRVPEDIGVATTSIHDTEIDTGIGQRPREIGRAAIRLLATLISEKSFGIPECYDELLIKGRWIDGSMMPKRDK